MARATLLTAARLMARQALRLTAQAVLLVAAFAGTVAYFDQGAPIP